MGKNGQSDCRNFKTILFQERCGKSDIDRYCVLIEIQGRLILILRKFDKVGS